MKTDGTKETFNNLIVDKHNTVIVCFGASWCEPCKAMHTILNEIESEYSYRLSLVYVDIEEQSDLAESYYITTIPTIIVYRNGMLVSGVVKSQTKENLLRLFGINV